MSGVDLCQSCGLCCDGSLFGRVQLAPVEVEPARRHGLRVLPSGRTFEQPCSALVGPGEARACGCYDARPERCRLFVCRLLDRVGRGEVALDEARSRVVRARELLDRVTAGGGLDDAEVRELTGYLDADLARAG